MATRVALVACIDATEGPWTLAKGNEVGIKISSLVEGERIELMMEVGELKESVTFDQSGTFPLFWRRMEKYRVCKLVKDGTKPGSTTVEIVLNGPAQGVSRAPNNRQRTARE